MSKTDSSVEIPILVSPEMPLLNTIWNILTPQTKKKRWLHCHKIKLVDMVQTT